jgi:Cu+-exporting ATPase
MELQLTQQKISCQHCGDQCTDRSIYIDKHIFCCEGCKTVYEILQENNLCTYYDIDSKPGLKIKFRSDERYAYLDNEEIVSSLIDFRENGIAAVHFFIPSIHCSSCIWLLEKLYKIEPGIQRSDVSFTKKEIFITYQEPVISLRRIVELLGSLGYTPTIQLDKTTKQEMPRTDRTVYYKIALAGFCASNIMLMSFPEYLGLDIIKEQSYAELFGYISIILGALVLFVAASDLYASAWAGLKNKFINLDLPIVIGMTALFSRSVYEVVTHIGTGYFDSLTGLIFFLLIGKWYQSKVYQAMSFERDYQSYFPVAVTRITEDMQKSVLLKDLKKGDEVLIRSQEIIPADAVLLSDVAYIDYSFVTGESTPVTKRAGETLYAGGRQTREKIHIRIEKEVVQSQLLQLWNDEVFTKKTSKAGISALADSFARNFTFALLIMSAITFGYWYLVDVNKAFNALTALLIVACPCALALSIPFAYGNAIRILAKHGLFLRSTDVVEKLNAVDTVVFDKTGTITKVDAAAIQYEGDVLSKEEKSMILTLVQHSTHPLSVKLTAYLHEFAQQHVLTDFNERSSKGLEGIVNRTAIRVGSASFADAPKNNKEVAGVHVSINSVYRGCFSIQHVYRENLEVLIQQLAEGKAVYVLSGDNDAEQPYLSTLFRRADSLFFNQTPADKLSFIKKLQSEGRQVLMVGDGLNDAGALKQSDVGISISENVYNFSPSCDGILEAEKLTLLNSVLRFCKGTVIAVKCTLLFSLLYNVVVITMAMNGLFTPVAAAVIMPVSSVFVVLLVVISTNQLARRLYIKK